MKRILFIAAMVSCSLLAQPAQAQVGVSVNIGLQPVWGPVGYDHVDYYYVPDVDAYYDVPNHIWIYQEGGTWVRRPNLPPAYASFDLYHGYKVVVNEPNPWMRDDVYRTKYQSFRGNRDQAVIRDSKEPKYYEVKEHPMHAQWKGDDHGKDKHDEKHNEKHEDHK